MTGAEVRHTTALKWFEIHASQRLQLLSGYLAGVAFVSAGIGGALSAKLPLVVSSLAGLLVVFTVVFDLLDQRTRQLIHVAEDALVASLLEWDDGNTSHENVVAKSRDKGSVLSYRQAFVLLYIVTVAFAIGSTVLAWWAN